MTAKTADPRMGSVLATADAEIAALRAEASELREQLAASVHPKVAELEASLAVAGGALEAIVGGQLYISAIRHVPAWSRVDAHGWASRAPSRRVEGYGAG